MNEAKENGLHVNFVIDSGDGRIDGKRAITQITIAKYF